MIENNMPFHKRVLLEKQKLAFLSITLSYENVFVSEAEVELRLADDDQTESVEIQESPPRSGKYTIQVEPNNYIISVRRKQFEDYDYYIDLKTGTNELEVVLKSIDPSPKLMNDGMNDGMNGRMNGGMNSRMVVKVVSVYNALTKIPIRNAVLTIFNKETYQEYVDQTNEDGIAEIEI